jgi:hypothetical protein
MIFRLSSLWAAALVGVCSFGYGAESVETFRVKFNPLIDRAVRHPTQFAVDVARRMDSESSGRWQVVALGVLHITAATYTELIFGVGQSRAIRSSYI